VLVYKPHDTKYSSQKALLGIISRDIVDVTTIANSHIRTLGLPGTFFIFTEQKFSKSLWAYWPSAQAPAGQQYLVVLVCGCFSRRVDRRPTVTPNSRCFHFVVFLCGQQLGPTLMRSLWVTTKPTNQHDIKPGSKGEQKPHES